MPRAAHQVNVFLDATPGQPPRRMGTLRHQSGRGGEVFSFEFGREWLAAGAPFRLDPDMALVEGPQYPAGDRTNFGIFLDSAPDRWGRLLMQRRENLRARKEGRAPRSLTDWDYLLGVHDETRLGALRFQDLESGSWLDSEGWLAAPPITSLAALQTASLRFERSEGQGGRESEKWLAQLFAPGSSLGGARPKASVRDARGALAIAKFPSTRDRRDMGAWELVANRLAAKAGITTPTARAMRIPGSAYTTFLATRFDRTPADGRVAFVSAMTLAQRRDGEPGASYLELVDLLQSRGSNTEADCRQLFRRVVFNILTHNTDDHLRNHGFLIGEAGITLSPAFDLNPTIESNHLTLAINEVETACDVTVAMEAHAEYGLSPAEATAIVAKVRKAVATWRAEATRLRIPKREQESMEPAFVSSR